MSVPYGCYSRNHQRLDNGCGCSRMKILSGYFNRMTSLDLSVNKFHLTQDSSHTRFIRHKFRILQVSSHCVNCVLLRFITLGMRYF